MAIASLILGIIAFFVSFSIFKDFSLILAVIGLVLGIISIFKKKNKGLSIVGIILTTISCIILFTGGNSNTTITNSDGIKTQNCKIGETITIKNNSGDEYTLQITGITQTDKRNEFSDKQPAQVFVIDYNYSCIKTTSGVYVSDMNFKIIDEKGEIGESYPISQKEPQSITAGTTCKAQMVLCVYNNSSKIKLQFFENMFNGTPNAIYEIEL